jgi:hypothetical protein
VFTKGLVSIGLARVAFAMLAGSLLIGRAGYAAQLRPILNFADVPILAASLGGISVGLIAREGAARTGSMLPLIGILCNGAVLALELVFSALALFRG